MVTGLNNLINSQYDSMKKLIQNEVSKLETTLSGLP